MATTTNNNNVTTKVNRYDVGSDDTSSSYENLAKTYNNSATNTNDYYNALNDESYKTMLNSEIQASQAKQQALKYTQNALQANGYSGQGVSESTMAGINSSYNNALSNAYSTYQGAINTNNVARQQALSDLDQNYYKALTTQQNTNYTRNNTAQSDAYTNYVAAMEETSNVNQLETIKNQAESSNLTDAQKAYIDTLYKEGKAAAESSNSTTTSNSTTNTTNTTASASSNGTGDLSTATAGTYVGKIDSVGSADDYAIGSTITDLNGVSYKVVLSGDQNNSRNITNQDIGNIFSQSTLKACKYANYSDGKITCLGQVSDTDIAKYDAKLLHLEEGKTYYALAVKGYNTWTILEAE